MSGHNRWAKIKHKKLASDAKKSQGWTMFLREITVSARTGGGDPNNNARLRTAIDRARSDNMPLDTISRAIKKGLGELGDITYEELTYEAYGPGGTAVVVEIMTDNRNRTAAEIRHLFTKFNGSLGAVGSVSWIFHKKGIINISKEGLDEDALIEAALDAGAEDVKSEDDQIFVVMTEPAVFQEVREKLEAAKFTVASAEIQNIPSNTKKLEGKDAENTLKLLSALEDHDDVQIVSANFDISDELIEQFQS
jgi:YebC/PmpR family DNA-binding regulatory protein